MLNRRTIMPNVDSREESNIFYIFYYNLLYHTGTVLLILVYYIMFFQELGETFSASFNRALTP